MVPEPIVTDLTMTGLIKIQRDASKPSSVPMAISEPIAIGTMRERDGVGAHDRTHAEAGETMRPEVGRVGHTESHPGLRVIAVGLPAVAACAVAASSRAVADQEAQTRCVSTQSSERKSRKLSATTLLRNETAAPIVVAADLHGRAVDNSAKDRKNKRDRGAPGRIETVPGNRDGAEMEWGGPDLVSPDLVSPDPIAAGRINAGLINAGQDRLDLIDRGRIAMGQINPDAGDEVLVLE